jgi:hypothetical protein
MSDPKSILNENYNKPINIISVELKGLEYTHPVVIQEDIQSILSSHTLEHLLENTRLTSLKLAKLGIIEDIQIQLDHSDKGALVILHVKEKKRLKAQAKTDYFDNTISMVVSLTLTLFRLSLVF